MASGESVKHSGFVVVVLATVLLGGVALVGSAGDVSASTHETDRPTVDTTVTEVIVHENGDATWTLEFRTRLESESEVQNYQDFQRAVENSTDSREQLLQTQLQDTASQASETTNRDMQIQGVTLTTRTESIPQRWGVASYTFTWTNFATVTDTELQVGDAFGDGMYLGPSDSLKITTDTAATVNSTTPTPDSQDSQTVSWNGQRQFSTDSPAVVFTYEPNEAPVTGSDNGRGIGQAITGLFVVSLAIWAISAYRRRTDVPQEPREQTDTEHPSEETSNTACGQSGGELLSDEETVVELIEENGGRVKQAEIVELTDWSSSKVSRLLKKMEEDNQLTRLRIGRENVVALGSASEYDEF